MKYILPVVFLILPFSAMAIGTVCVENQMSSKYIKTCLNGKDCKKFKNNTVSYQIQKQQDQLSVSVVGTAWDKTVKGKNLKDGDIMYVWGCNLWSCYWFHDQNKCQMKSKR